MTRVSRRLAAISGSTTPATTAISATMAISATPATPAISARGEDTTE